MNDTDNHVCENKSLTPTNPEITAAFGEFMGAFEAFKESNDIRLSQLETHQAVDPLTDQKLSRINQTLDQQKKQLDELCLKAQRPGYETFVGANGTAQEHKQAFSCYVRSGDESDLRRIETKALSYGSDQDGGFLVPEETATEIGKRLLAVSPVRALCGVKTVSSSVYKKPFAVSGPMSGWVNETDARWQTASPSLSELQFPTMELYAMPAATATLLEDVQFDLDTWIADEVETVFAQQEGAAFVSGDGVAKPSGFLTTPKVDESNWSWGNIGTLATGENGSFSTTNPVDRLIDMVYALKSSYRQNAAWIMNRKVQAEIRKLKDGDGNYIWQPPAIAGAPASILGFTVAESEDMPDISDGSYSMAFGDFRRGYLIVDRAGVSVLRDPYSAKPYVLFYMTKRVGGGVQDFDAIKLLKFGSA